MKRGDAMDMINKWLTNPSTNPPSHRGEMGVWERWREA
jgi:hypothetical protein